MNFPYTKSTECYYCAGGIANLASFAVQRVQAGGDIGTAQHKPGCPVVELAKERIGQPWPEMPATPIDEEVTKETTTTTKRVRFYLVGHVLSGPSMKELIMRNDMEDWVPFLDTYRLKSKVDDSVWEWEKSAKEWRCVS